MLQREASFSSPNALSLSPAALPRFSSQPAPSVAHQGDSAVMSCEGNPDLVPFVRWERNRERVAPDGRLIQLPSGALVVSNASQADAGLYRCVVENVGPAKVSEEAELQVLPGTAPLSSDLCP